MSQETLRPPVTFPVRAAPAGSGEPCLAPAASVWRHPMRRLLSASATLAAILFMCACGSSGSQSSAPPSSCSGVSAPHTATVVVTHSDGSTQQRCVGFSSSTISGAQLMQKSKFEFVTQTFSYGKAACEIDNQPRHFTECLPKSGDYWALYVLQPGSSSWQQAQSGYATTMIKPGGALGWRYESETASPAPTPPLPKK